jgi:hypothetical protein
MDFPSTKQFKFARQASVIASGDGTDTFDNAIVFASSSKKQIKLVTGNISKLIPNVFNYGGVNTGLVRVSKDAGLNWTSIQLENGIYSVTQISNAINSTVSAWYTDSASPALEIHTNTAVEKVYLTLDSSKLLVPGQIAIDFSLSSISALLGFTAPTSFLVDGTYEADAYAQVDWFGNLLSVQLVGFGTLSIADGHPGYELCQVDLTQSAGNLYLVDGSQYTFVDINPSLRVNSYQVQFIGSRSNRPIVFLEQDTSLIFIIREITD